MKHFSFPARLLLTLFPALALIAAACGSGGNETQATKPAPSPTTAAAAVDLSKDDLGRSVTVPANPKRVVAMSPSIVELMYAVGATPIGGPSSADFPEAAKSLPNFGTSYTPNLELIVAMKPDLIIADGIIHAGTINDLAKLGAPVFALRVNSFADVVSGLRKVGALTGNAKVGNDEAKKLEDKLAAILAKKPALSPSVLVVVGAGANQVYAARGDSYVGDILQRLGAKNIISNEPDTFRLPGFTDYSLERIVEKDPDVIIAISPGPPNAPKTSDGLSKSPVWSGLKAVKNKRVVEVDPTIYLQAAGPRVSLILDELARLLYPDVFKAS